MTHATKRARIRPALPAAALATLLLAGCSTGQIGESWQCPLAEGGLCDSVAAADPAVPDAGASDGAVLGEPLWRVRDAGAPMASAETPPTPELGQACAAECDGGFDPFAWLARLFAAEVHEGEARPAAEAAPALSTSAARVSDAVPGEDADAPVEPAAALPAEAALPVQPEAAEEDADAGDLRTGEVVARIWIAPFVDANGVYREASHVRVVLEPAGWRLR